MILYLHGFRSSPHSFKAQFLGQRLQELGWGADYLCPQLPPSPRQAIELASKLIERYPADQINLIGSSLGGYYATWLAEQTGCRAVLLNPAVKPPRDLEKYVGMTTDYHSGEPFEFTHEHVDELHALAIDVITLPQRYFLIAATGDEVLDWREMTAHYAGARQQIIQGGDHGISDFADYLPAVLEFCGIQQDMRL